MSVNRRKFLTGFLTFCLLFLSISLTGRAEEEKPKSGPYTYTVTFYAGNQGAFTGSAGVTVQSSGSGVVKSMREDGSAITVSGLHAGDRVTFDNIQSREEDAPVKLEENSQYYVRGIRASGYDNDTVSSPSFTVGQDQDYVVAYGIEGEMVSYVVRYEDKAGNTLVKERKYYGNVGDWPVVAHLYIEGYEPQAYNLTKKLSENEAENVFTFVYSRVSGGSGSGGSDVIDERTNVIEVPGGVNVINGADGTGGDGGVTVIEGANAAAGGGGAAAAGGADGAGGAEDNTNLDDEDVPLSDGPEELVNLDDEETPLAFSLGNLDGAKNMLGAVVVGVSGLAALLALIIIFIKRRRKEQENI